MDGRRAGTLGALLLGEHDPTSGDLLYIGDVGTGLTDRALRDLHARLAPLGRPTWPFAAAPPRENARHVHWVEPTLVGEVVYRQFTRGPPPSAAPSAEGRAVDEQRVTVRVEQRQLVLTNMNKVLYPAAGFSKGEVLNYYSRVAPMLLPHLAGRPVTFIRYPDGVEGEKFFEKNVPRHARTGSCSTSSPAPTPRSSTAAEWLSASTTS